MRTIYTLPFLLIVSFCSFSQSTNISTLLHSNVKKADQLFEHFAYRNALEIYLHANEKNPGDYYIRERIAMCYFKLHDPKSAELWYSSLAQETDIHPEAKFEYAEALSMTGNYDESLYWFKQYLKDKPKDQIALDKIAFLKDLKKYSEDTKRFIITDVDFNTDHSEYGAHYFHDGVVFASSRDLDLFIKHKPFDALYPHEALLNLYYVARKPTGEWESFVPFHTEHLKTYYHEGPMAFYDNYKKGAFTQSNLKNGKPVYDANGRVNLKIYFAEVAHLGEFKNIVPFEYNNDGYSVAHPTFSQDGKVMYFSSTAPSGFGESDIYYTTFENGRWTEPVNIGATINSREDESFPYLTNDSTLYFTSNGHGTLGGLDLYISYKRGGKFTKPINLGTPINSMYDDFSLVTDSTGREGYIASNRPGGKGIDDIYFFISNYYFLAGETRDIALKERVPNATVSAFNGNGDLIASTQSDSLGNFALNLPYDQDYVIRGEKEGYETVEDLTFSTRGKPFGVDSLLLPLRKRSLFAKGRIVDADTQQELIGATVLMYDVLNNHTESIVLNDKSEYTFLLRPEMKYKIEATKEGYIPNGFELDTKGMVTGDISNDIALRSLDSDANVVYFAFDKSIITDAAKQKLDVFIKSLEKSSGTKIIISSHADSRGTRQYNQSLSERRANATMQYLISKGIDKERIETYGYGEDKLRNNCSDGVNCTENDHARNRRSELSIQYLLIDDK